MSLSDIRERAIAQNNTDAKHLIGEIERLRSTYMRDCAARMLDVRPNVLDFFEVTDPLNPQNEVLGFLSHQADHRYGALAILQVNGHDCPQVVYATPKLHYPFSKDPESCERKYRWPVCQRGAAYPKLDGTNVCLYSYADHNGKRYVTAKVRLHAFLRNGKFGPFIDMWKEMVQACNVIVPKEVRSGEVALSFEMYGYRNLITVKYPVPLQVTLLFGVRQSDASPLVPTECPDVLEHLRNPCEFDVSSGENLTAEYERIRADAETKCIVTGEGDEREITGMEGYVLYLLTDDKHFVTSKRWLLYKIKPSEIEELHWQTSELSYKSILPTAWNALETVEPEQLTFEVMKVLLLEEFAEDKIEAARPLVEKAITRVQASVAFRAAVQKAFEEAPDKSNRGAIMRYMASVRDTFDLHMAKLYHKSKPGKRMQILYASLLQLGLVKEERCEREK